MRKHLTSLPHFFARLAIGMLMSAVGASSFGAPLGPIEEPLWMRYPAISPDGSQIAFSYMGNLYLVPAAGGGARCSAAGRLRSEAHGIMKLLMECGAGAQRMRTAQCDGQQRAAAHGAVRRGGRRRSGVHGSMRRSAPTAQ